MRKNTVVLSCSNGRTIAMRDDYKMIIAAPNSYLGAANESNTKKVVIDVADFFSTFGKQLVVALTNMRAGRFPHTTMVAELGMIINTEHETKLVHGSIKLQYSDAIGTYVLSIYDEAGNLYMSAALPKPFHSGWVYGSTVRHARMVDKKYAEILARLSSLAAISYNTDIISEGGTELH